MHMHQMAQEVNFTHIYQEVFDDGQTFDRKRKKKVLFKFLVPGSIKESEYQEGRLVTIGKIVVQWNDMDYVLECLGSPNGTIGPNVTKHSRT